MSDRFFAIRKLMIKANGGKSPIKGHGAIEVHQALGFSKLFNTARPAKYSSDSKAIAGDK